MTKIIPKIGDCVLLRHSVWFYSGREVFRVVGDCCDDAGHLLVRLSVPSCFENDLPVFMVLPSDIREVL